MINKNKRVYLAALICVTFIFASFSSVLAAEYDESPMLQERVESGKLPSVAERLPDNPVVVETVDKIGKYGGTIRMGFTRMGYALGSFLSGRFSDQTPFTWSTDGGTLKPNWVSSYEVSEDGKVITIKIREGIKWSDGVPVTTDDLLFSYNDYVFNEDLSPGDPPPFLENLTELEKVGKYTLKYHYSKPNPLFKYGMNVGKFGSAANVIMPKHYMKQFHPKYTSEEELVQAVEDADMDNWIQLFEAKLDMDNLDRPVLRMWKTVEVTPDKVIAERNPYYWKVDSEGNQLPYIDKVRFDIVSSADVITMKAMAGVYDFVLFHIKLADFPTLKKSEDKGNYKVMLWDGAVGDVILSFNHTLKEDEVLGDLLSNVKFKKALSYSINRNEVNEKIYMGLGKPIQLSPPKGSPVYKEEFGNMYAEYSPSKAKELLDELGIVDSNGDGWREKPNGDSLSINFIAAQEWGQHSDVAELLVSYWRNIGLKFNLKLTQYHRYPDFTFTNKYEVAMWKGILAHPLYITRVGTGIEGSFGATAWIGQTWLEWVESDGEKGEKPPAEYLEGNRLMSEFKSTVDPEKRAELGIKLWENFYDNLWKVGVVQQVARPVVVSNRVKNVPQKGVMAAYQLKTPSNAKCFQWYMEE